MSTAQGIIINKLLSYLAESRASDLHLTIGSQPLARHHGVLDFVPGSKILTASDLQEILEFFLNKKEQDKFKIEKEIITIYNLEGRGRFRVNILLQKEYPEINIRYIPLIIPSLESLGWPKEVNNLAKLENGLIIIGGFYGSGRTTTSVALIEEINKLQTKHIITLERPQEFQLISKKSIIEQREISRDIESFERGLEFIQEEDADVIFISELLSPGVISRALEISAAGKLVIGCFDGYSAVNVIEKLIHSFLPNSQPNIRDTLGKVLSAVLVQRLLPKVGGGQVLAHEILLSNEAIKSLIIEGRINQINNILQTSRNEGMISFDQCLFSLVRDGELMVSEAMKVANDPGIFKSIG